MKVAKSMALMIFALITLVAVSAISFSSIVYQDAYAPTSRRGDWCASRFDVGMTAAWDSFTQTYITI